MSRTFRQYVRKIFFNREKDSAISKLQQKLKAESRARAEAEEKLRLEIASKEAAEQKIMEQAEQKLLTQHRRYSVLAERMKAEAKQELSKVKAQLKEALEKLDSYEAEKKQKEEKIKEILQKLDNVTSAKTRAQESLKVERHEHRKAEAKAKEEIAQVKAHTAGKIQPYPADSSHAQEKPPKAAEPRYAGRKTAVQISEGDQRAEREEQNIYALPEEAPGVLKRICSNLFHLISRKRKVALLSALAILFVIAITFGISIVTKPPVARPDNVTTREDEPVLINLMPGESDREYLTYSIVKDPSHGRLSGKAPDITYTPVSNYHGQDRFTYKIHEAKVDKNQAAISIEVLPANDTPVAYHRSESIKVNKSLTATLTGSDVDGDPLIFNISKEPEHGTLTFDSNFNTSGKLIYTPEPNFTGIDTFSFKINDGKADSAPATVSINISPNTLPIAESLTVTTPEDTPVSIVLTGSDLDSDPLSYIIVSEPSDGRLSGNAPNLTYTPNENFNGSDSFSFKVNDGTADSTTATVSITISSVNDPPKANDDSVVTREDIPSVKIDVLKNDTDIDNEGRHLYLDTFSVTSVTQGKNGSVYINTDGSVSYSPDENFYGNDEFTYTVSDNKGDSDTAKVTVTVNPTNDPPSITSVPVTITTVGALYTYDVNAIDPDLTDKLTYSLTTKPDNMTINPNTGLIEWKSIELGENEVTVMVADSNGIPATDVQSFIITVNPPPPKIAKITPRDGYDQRNRKTLSAEGKNQLVRASDDSRLSTSFGSYVSFDFSYVDVPNDVKIKSVVVCVEHFEEEGYVEGKLEWAVGTGWPGKPVVWASLKAPIHEQQSYESVDSWDIISLIDSREKLNSLQLQIKNNDYQSRKTTMTDHVYIVVEWE